MLKENDLQEVLLWSDLPPYPRYVISAIFLVTCGLPLVGEIQTMFSFGWFSFGEQL